MKTLKDIKSEIINILGTDWKIRNGEKVPDSKDIQLGNDAVYLDATVLYADLKESTKMVRDCEKTFSAEIYKCYLTACCELIKNNSGKITSFDGDRVMGVFIGESKNTCAVKTALQINYIVKNVINIELPNYWNTSYKLQQVVGIDTCKLLVARTGIRGDNDLVWVGNAANLAAKMCSIRDGNYSTYITANVYKIMNDYVKYKSELSKINMWESYYWKDYDKTIYRSTYYWKPE